MQFDIEKFIDRWYFGCLNTLSVLPQAGYNLRFYYDRGDKCVYVSKEGGFDIYLVDSGNKVRVDGLELRFFIEDSLSWDVNFQFNDTVLQLSNVSIAFLPERVFVVDTDHHKILYLSENEVEWLRKGRVIELGQLLGFKILEDNVTSNFDFVEIIADFYRFCGFKDVSVYSLGESNHYLSIGGMNIFIQNKVDFGEYEIVEVEDDDYILDRPQTPFFVIDWSGSSLHIVKMCDILRVARTSLFENILPEGLYKLVADQKIVIPLYSLLVRYEVSEDDVMYVDFDGVESIDENELYTYLFWLSGEVSCRVFEINVNDELKEKIRSMVEWRRK